MKQTIFILLILNILTKLPAQNAQTISLKEVLDIAQKQSLDAFKSKNMYLASYWDYRSFVAKQLPFVDLNLNPFDLRRTITKRYDFDQNVDVFREQKTLDSYANLSLNQNIPFTGGKIYIDSDLSRLLSYGETEITTFSATLIRFGLVQPLFAYNDLKWEKKLSPLKFDKEKQEYNRSLEET
ncbi:MAG: TolC family protein, partial [Bacteroidales bacterium]|nr:TolC family protein [Bacteroidales bacterium]